MLDFHTRKFLTSRLVHKAQMHYHAKFRQNRSNGWGDMVSDFLIFLDRSRQRFGFSNLANFTS